MSWLPPISTLFPYTTLFRSAYRCKSGKAIRAAIDLRDRYRNLVSSLERQYAAFKRCGKAEDRKSTRLNSSHTVISYAVFCLKKKNNKEKKPNTTRTIVRPSK